MAMTKVLVNFIQDRSGSMGSVWDETLNGFKEFVKSLKDNKEGVDYLFSLTTFDTVTETPFLAKPISEVSEDALRQHGPRGSTALYDAVGATLKNTESITADKYIVVIVTDGEENSSREWSKDALQKAVEERLAKGNWTFTYLGTQPETWADAGAFGIAATSAATYTPTQAQAAYSATANAVRCFSASTRMGTRSLMADYVPDAVAANAGMRKQPKSQTPAQHKSKSAGRWR
jgi:hypothetical protein